MKSIALILAAGMLALPAGLAFLGHAGHSPQGLAHRLAASAAGEPGQAAASVTLAHVRNEFEFTVHAPYAKAAPLFGADAERVWAGSSWNPKFVYPASAPLDVPGAVFTVEHGGHHATWVCTSFDLKVGHVQYVYVIGGALATLIDIHLAPVDAATTRVQVAYERTALTPEANDHVREMGDADRNSGKEWQGAIEGYLKSGAQE
jgi:hypothetical protein